MRLRGSIAEPRRAVNLAALVACAFFARAAVAHPEYAPSTINRYVKFDLVAPDAVRLAYTVMVGPGPAAVARRGADANADGKLDASETRALGEEARRAVTAGVHLTVDGKPVAVRFDEPVVGLAGDEVGPSPFSVDLIAHLSLSGAPPHTIGFDDETPEPQLGGGFRQLSAPPTIVGDSEIVVEESPSTRLIASHRGATGDEKETRFVFRGPKFSALEDRSIAFTFTAGAHHATDAALPPSSSRRWLWELSSVLLVLVAAGALVLARRRR